MLALGELDLKLGELRIHGGFHGGGLAPQDGKQGSRGRTKISDIGATLAIAYAGMLTRGRQGRAFDWPASRGETTIAATRRGEQPPCARYLRVGGA
jgi:hypothetical protein